MSYGGVRSHPTLLPHAKDELDTICERLYGFATRLFPALPAPAAQAWISDPEKESVLVTPRSLFFPVLLPPIYPTLFHLYIQQEEKLDKVGCYCIPFFTLTNLNNYAYLYIQF